MNDAYAIVLVLFKFAAFALIGVAFSEAVTNDQWIIAMAIASLFFTMLYVCAMLEEIYEEVKK